MKTVLLLVSMAVASLAASQPIKVEDNKLVLDKPVLFKTGTAELLPESEEALKSVKAFLEEKIYITTMRVEGRVTSGTPEQSQSLSEQRAQTVVKRLVKAGMDCKRLLATGFGNTKPIVDNSSSERALNNRIVFAMAALRGRAIGSMPLDGGGKIVGNACE